MTPPVKPESKTKAGGDGGAPLSLLEIALPILQGLLASGRYTFDDPLRRPQILRQDNGKDWRTKDGGPVNVRRLSSMAVEDAVLLACELHDEVNLVERRIADYLLARTKRGAADLSTGSLPHDPSPTREDAR